MTKRLSEYKTLHQPFERPKLFLSSLRLVNKAILDETLACLFHTADIGLYDWLKVNWIMNHMGANPCVPLFNHIRILRLLEVNNHYISYTKYPYDHERGVSVAAHANSVHCRLLSKCANVHTLTLKAPYFSIASHEYDQYRGYSIDDYFKDFDLQVVLALKHLRKVVVVGAAKHKMTVNGIHGFVYLQGCSQKLEI
jgi:hypothetical protein